MVCLKICCLVGFCFRSPLSILSNTSRQATGRFWQKSLAGDLLGGFAALGLDQLEEAYKALVARRAEKKASTMPTYQEFLTDDLLCKSAFVHMGQVERNEGLSMPEAVDKVYQLFVDLNKCMNSEAGQALFPALAKELASIFS